MIKLNLQDMTAETLSSARAQRINRNIAVNIFFLNAEVQNYGK